MARISCPWPSRRDSGTTRARLLVWAVMLCPGCAGGGTAHMVPLMRSDLPPNEPLFSTISVSEAYYWTDDDGELNIALGCRVPSVFGKAFAAEWLMSIVLDELPAGSEKLYKLGAREVRTVETYGGDHRRSRSVSGVAVVHAPRHGRWGRLKGRFHVWVRQQQFGVLTGWFPPMDQSPTFIALGSFEAVPDAGRGREILDRTEADGFDRLTMGPTARPTRVQPAATATASATAPAS